MKNIEPQIENFASRFCPGFESLNVLKSSRNTVAEVQDKRGLFILKIKDANSTYGKMTRNEVDWIRHLHSNSIGVPELVLSMSGQLIERLASGQGDLIGYCYKKIEFETDRRTYWSDSNFVQQLGRTIGKMHTLADGYCPAEPDNMPAWDHPEWLKNPGSFFHSSQSGIADAIRKLMTELASLPQAEGFYGLIHDDLHTGNVFKSGENLMIIDFECLHMNWYLAEIASTLLFRTWIGPSKETAAVKENAVRFMRDLLAGYVKEHSIEPHWSEHINLFFKLREISQFAGYAGVNIDSTNDPLIRYLYLSIRENRLFLDIDIEKIM